MTRAAKRKRTVPCELCRFARTEDGEMWCAQFAMLVLGEDGCTFGEEGE